MDPSLPFVRPYRVRFDEAGADGHVRASALVRYLQDLAWQHSEAAGYDRAWYAARGLGWLVRGLELELVGRACHGSTITVTTRITGWRRMWCRRETTIGGPDGGAIARARIDWVLLDSAGRPVRVPSEIEAFAPDARSFTPTRVGPPPTSGPSVTVAAAVRAADVDPMGHLNNAGYLDLVEEALHACGRAIGPGTALRLEYLQPALPGMVIDVAAWADGPSVAVQVRAAGASVDLLRAGIDRTTG